MFLHPNSSATGSVVSHILTLSRDTTFRSRELCWFLLVVHHISCTKSRSVSLSDSIFRFLSSLFWSSRREELLLFKLIQSNEMISRLMPIIGPIRALRFSNSGKCFARPSLFTSTHVYNHIYLDNGEIYEEHQISKPNIFHRNTVLRVTANTSSQ